MTSHIASTTHTTDIANTTASSVLGFHGCQMGDVTARDVVGGNVYNTYVVFCPTLVFKKV
jgi:hypothetical protein